MRTVLQNLTAGQLKWLPHTLCPSLQSECCHLLIVGKRACKKISFTIPATKQAFQVIALHRSITICFYELQQGKRKLWGHS